MQESYMLIDALQTKFPTCKILIEISDFLCGREKEPIVNDAKYSGVNEAENQNQPEKGLTMIY